MTRTALYLRAVTGNSAPSILGPDADGIARAAALLRAGDIAAIPTETVYGLAARADSDAAVARIYRAKGRPGCNPLIVHVAGLAEAAAIGVLDARAAALADAFWPGPLTLVVPLKAGAEVAAAVVAGLPTVALRVPAHPIARAVLAAAGLPLAAPSANASGGVSPTRPAHVAASLGARVPLVLDGGECPGGIESSIVALRADGGWQVLRPGPIGAERIVQVLGTQPTERTEGAIEAPGQLASHYAPGKPVRLNATHARTGEFHIGFGAVAGDVSLSASGDLAEAASSLYALLHVAAAAPQPRIAVAPVPEAGQTAGLGAAINDRLRRAAA